MSCCGRKKNFLFLLVTKCPTKNFLIEDYTGILVILPIAKIFIAEFLLALPSVSSKKRKEQRLRTVQRCQVVRFSLSLSLSLSLVRLVSLRAIFFCKSKI